MLHPKAALIEHLQREGLGAPQYATEREGPEHEPTFRSRVRVGRKLLGEGTGGNKREAERRAAEAALAATAAAPIAAASPRAASGKAKKKGAKAAAAPAVEPAEPQTAALSSTAGFAGPWPLVPELLVESLRIADQRVDAKLRGDLALAAIETFALRLYKDTLEDLGELVDEEA